MSKRVPIITQNDDPPVTFIYHAAECELNGKQSQSDRVIVVNSKMQYTTSPVALSSLPSQTFYHSHIFIFMPFICDENVNDSEKDIYTHWVEQLNDETLDEISDVNDKEKLKMKIWNRFIETQRLLTTIITSTKI
ncbi:12730_t:CDS:2 [Funneliformis caledonium]|uniref:12730_t:CDS:1 n=1 Tax=Funneliformis caledonium TaxID=1117310 RepID=A0A9N9FEU7_9GLOM|nr:12730_t:CDS:2 [Funneliformis caledonium]